MPRLIAVLLLALGAPVAALAQAAQTPLAPAVIGVIDRQYILTNAVAAESIRVQMDAILAVYSAEIADNEDRLRAREQELKLQQGILAPEVYTLRVDEFQKSYDDLQKLAQDRQAQLNATLNDAMSKVQDALLRVAMEIADARGINLVLEKRDDRLLFAARSLDITADVLAVVDQRLPKVDVPIPPAQ